MINKRLQLSKMKVKLNNPVEYWLKSPEGDLFMNGLIGSNIQLKFSGEINCTVCGDQIKKVFGQGFCYPCFANAPENSECIIRPELCRGHEGIGRDAQWEKENHVIDHTVYLALTSGVKVGITRGGNESVRWIDQGAWKTIKLATTPDRYTCGLIEVAIKEHISDKTNWQRMLKDEKNTEIDLLEMKDELIEYIPEELQDFVSDDDEIIEINYPVENYPAKVKSLNLDKTPEIRGKLVGIRGQYLIFEEGNVINLRKFSGYTIEISQLETVPKEGQTSLF